MQATGRAGGLDLNVKSVRRMKDKIFAIVTIAVLLLGCDNSRLNMSDLLYDKETDVYPTIYVLTSNNEDYLCYISEKYDKAKVEIEVEAYSQESIDRYIASSIISGSSEWDLFSVTHLLTPIDYYISKGVIYPLDDYILKMDDNEWYLQIFDFCRYKDKLYIYPVGITIDVLIGNKDCVNEQFRLVESFLEECNEYIHNSITPIKKNRFNLPISIPISPIVEYIQNKKDLDNRIILKEMFEINKKMSNEVMYGNEGVYEYVLSAGVKEIDEAGEAIMVTPGIELQDKTIKGSSTIQEGFSVFDSCDDKDKAFDYLIFLSKNEQFNISAYKYAHQYINKTVVDNLLDSISCTQFTACSETKEIAIINNMYIEGKITLKEALDLAIECINSKNSN